MTLQMYNHLNLNLEQETMKDDIINVQSLES